MLLTLLRLREYRQLLHALRKTAVPGHVELEIEVPFSPVGSRISSTSSFRIPVLPQESPRSQERQMIRILDIPVTYRSRSSQDTASSCSPDMLLVADGFRPLEEPPAYNSRPPSLHSYKGD